MPSLVVNVDCTDPDRMADFWSAALGYDRSGGVEQYRSIRPAAGSVDGPKILFQGVSARTPGKNAWHVDIDLDRDQSLDDEVARLVTLGATPVSDTTVDEFGLTWRVLHDPEGNVFCVVAPAATT